MKAKLRTEELVIAKLLEHYIQGEFGQAEIEPKALFALFDLPPSGEILHRNAWLYRAARCSGNEASVYERARRLSAAIVQFKRERLPGWAKDLQEAGPLPGLFPANVRSTWINQLLIRTHRQMSFDVDYCLHFAFANSRRVPASVRVLYSIIKPSTTGPVGNLRRHLYDEIGTKGGVLCERQDGRELAREAQPDRFTERIVAEVQSEPAS